jgi:hypothetical protein
MTLGGWPASLESPPNVGAGWTHPCAVNDEMPVAAFRGHEPKPLA